LTSRAPEDVDEAPLILTAEVSQPNNARARELRYLRETFTSFGLVMACVWLCIALEVVLLLRDFFERIQ
jgi:hypothetical protein